MTIMVNRWLALQQNGEANPGGRFSLAAQNKKRSAPQGRWSEGVLACLVPKADALLLRDRMRRHTVSKRLGSLRSRITRKVGPKEVAARYHYPDGTEEAVLLHDDGEDMEDGLNLYDYYTAKKDREDEDVADEERAE